MIRKLLKMMKPISLLFYYFAFCLAEKYVPGTPGASWSFEEMLIVKAKLYSVFSKNGGYKALRTIYGENMGNWVSVPTEPKYLRLAFHDCLKYEDGSGGCDGCINWEGMDFRYEDKPGSWRYKDVIRTSNTNLDFTMEVLHHIYIDKDFPRDSIHNSPMAPSLNVSLEDSGKSRADLLAFAAIVAVEFSIETNNMVCDGTYNNNPSVQCHQEQGKPFDCIVEMPRPIKFKTGRRDCPEFIGEPYKSSKKERQPMASGNGLMTVDFFASEFGFSGRETAAIMGAHTLGRMHVWISLYRYEWTTRATRLFNNQYYKNIVRQDKVAFNDNQCTLVTDAEGNIPKTRWVAHTRLDTVNGGPVHWIHENYNCPNCVSKPDDKCCQNVPENQFCLADADKFEDDPNVNSGCEMFRLVSGLDEMALPSEIGLYFDFNVTADGIPYGCPGLDTFYPQNWNVSYQYQWSALPKDGIDNPTVWSDYRKADPNCNLNTLQYPPDETPLHQIIEEYAESQTKWVKDFVPTFEKMLENGYAQEDLEDGPDQFTNVICPRSAPNDKTPFYACFIA